ncbi:MAG: hypothetical protein ICV79_05050 [Flavisolibacter sp.]|nr:hypothetical protein [Flavisolibacter sp.]
MNNMDGLMIIFKRLSYDKNIIRIIFGVKNGVLVGHNIKLIFGFMLVVN